MFRDCLLKKYVSLNGKTINEELARCIVEEMPVTNGTQRKNGERYDFECARSIGETSSADFTRIKLSEWYLVLNYKYKEHYKTACKYNQGDNDNFFASLALDWFNSVDYTTDKTFNFFMNN